MHTFLTRANALAAYTMSVLAGLTMVCFLSTFFLDYRTGSEINTVKVYNTIGFLQIILPINNANNAINNAK